VHSFGFLVPPPIKKCTSHPPPSVCKLMNTQCGTRVGEHDLRIRAEAIQWPVRGKTSVSLLCVVFARLALLVFAPSVVGWDSWPGATGFASKSCLTAVQRGGAQQCCQADTLKGAVRSDSITDSCLVHGAAAQCVCVCVSMCGCFCV
jgi:hypothetical protein